MNIQEIQQKCKVLWTDQDVFFAVLLTVVAVISFCLGRLAPAHMPYAAPEASTARVVNPSVYASSIKLGSFVASKEGGAYHFPWCAGAQRIKDENKIWFASVEEAEAAGYTRAANCKGL